jgi:hypothetical protein
MPGKSKEWRFTAVGNDVVMLHKGEVVTDPNVMRKVALSCPRCGEQAQGYILKGTGYIELWHRAQGGRQHRWCLGPSYGKLGPFLLKLVSHLPHAEEARLSEEEREAVYEVYVQRKKVPEDVRKKAREALLRLLGR